MFDDLLLQNQDPAMKEFPVKSAQAFYRETLLTYRVIFSQDANSWKLFSRNFSSDQLQNGDKEGLDPMFRKLTAKPWRKQQVYAKIQADPAKLVYSEAEFPFFGYRLRKLQDFVVTQAPDDFWSLMNDRRDINRLWTIRAAVFFGLGASFLAIVQIAVGIVQLKSN